MKHEIQKKPVIIDAIKFLDGDCGLHSTILGLGCLGFSVVANLKYNPLRIEIQTLEGTMCAYPGDYIIKGVNGEFYPCKEDVFKKTYEEV